MESQLSKDYDPYMHTVQHILNQTMVRMFGCGRSFSAHIERKKSKCDYHFDRSLTEDELTEVARRVNGVIASNAQVVESFMPRVDAEKIFSLSSLPDDAGDPLRIIQIGDYDSCPCRGEHVGSAGELTEFRIISSSHADGVLRVRFTVKQMKDKT